MTEADVTEVCFKGLHFFRSKYKRGSIVVSFLNLKKRGVRIFFEPFNSTVLKVDLFLLEPDLPGNLTSQ